MTGKYHWGVPFMNKTSFFARKRLLRNGIAVWWSAFSYFLPFSCHEKECKRPNIKILSTIPPQKGNLFPKNELPPPKQKDIHWWHPSPQISLQSTSIRQGQTVELSTSKDPPNFPPHDSQDSSTPHIGSWKGWKFDSLPNMKRSTRLETNNPLRFEILNLWNQPTTKRKSHLRRVLNRGGSTDLSCKMQRQMALFFQFSKEKDWLFTHKEQEYKRC